MSLIKRSGISYIEVLTNHKSSSQKSSNDGAGKTVILFHGFGADAYDLKSLSEALAVSGNTRWIFPQGILEVPIGPGWTGRAWWPIDMNRFQSAQLDPQFTLADVVPDNIESLRTKVDDLLSSLNINWETTILGGFSQGAMLAVDTFLRAPNNPLGLIALSGALINKKDWQGKVQARKGCRFFQSHGRQDPILPYRVGSQLESFLTSNGLKGSIVSFDGTHEIPWNVIEKANAYIAEYC